MSFTLAHLGWDAERDAEFAAFAATSVPGRVSRVDRDAVDVLTADNPLRVATAAADPSLTVGDWVALAVDGRRWYVESILTRRTEIRRAASSGRAVAQSLAANVDVVLVVVPAVPEPRPGMTERLVAVGWDSGATPVVVMTKSDLAVDPGAVEDDLRRAAPGVDVVPVTTARADGYDALRGYLQPGTTCCLLGRSGAGKSTLVNALAGARLLATAEIRADGKGQHTTTFRELVPLPSGAVLVDTPGLRGVGMWGDEGLDQAFADVTDLAASCRFTDCRHDTEPGCAVTAAIDDGRLEARRLVSWRKLEREAAWVARRNDARLCAEESRRWKSITMQMRRSGRPRP